MKGEGSFNGSECTGLETIFAPVVRGAAEYHNHEYVFKGR